MEFDETRALEDIKHEHKKDEISHQGDEDRKTEKVKAELNRSKSLSFDEQKAMEELKHQNAMEEIRYKAEEDRKTEATKAENAKQLEKKKSKGGLILKVVGVVAGGLVTFGLTCLADHLEVPRKNVPKNLN